jgi:PAS domain S-box-containing protein
MIMTDWVSIIPTACAVILAILLAILYTSHRTLLQRQTEFRQDIFERITAGILIVSPTRHILEVNRQLCQMYGYSREELVGQSAEILHLDREKFERFGQWFDNARNDGPLVQIEYQYRRKDGETFWAVISGGALTLPDGNTGVVWSLTDISDRKQMEAELAGERSHMERLFEVNGSGMLVVSSTRQILQVNSQFCFLFGYSREELVGQSAKILHVDQQHYEDWAPCFQEARAGLPFASADYPWRRKDGSIFWCLFAGVKMQLANGEPGVLWNVIDISERKRGEDERRRLVTAIEQSIDSVVITDKNGRIQYVNPSFEKTTGYRKDEVIGKNPKILQSGRHDPYFYQEMWKTLANGRAWKGHLINKKKDGTLFEEEVSITPVLNEAGEIMNFVAVKRDVTEQRKLEEQLSQAQKMESIGTLAGGIAHDFNNILAAILGFSELALYSLPPDAAARKNIDKIIHSGNRAAALVQQILDFSRKTEQSLQPLQPHLIIQEVLQMLRFTLPATVTIKEELDPAAGIIMADATKLHQVVLNLCTNAFQALKDEKGILLVTLTRQKKTTKSAEKDTEGLTAFVVFSVSDTGLGMDQETAAHIFDPYFTTKVQGMKKGTGLGLAVVNGIVESYHGFIEVESTPGKGSTFRVFIPALENSHAILEGPKQQEAAGLDPGRGQILVVDDEPLLVEVIVKTLENFGYTVTGVTDSREALEKVRARPNRFDLIITDQTMPGLTGSELAKAILEIVPHMPVIICTGYSAVTSAEDARAMGIKKYIHKPIDTKELTGTVRMLLDEKKLKAES